MAASREASGQRASAGGAAAREVRVFEQPNELYAAAARHIAMAAARAVAERGRFVLVMAGGTTPMGVYARLGAAGDPPLDWERLDLFWGDERCVPPDHPESNYGMAARSLLDRIAIPAHRVHRIQGEQPAGVAAATYDSELATFFAARTPADLGPRAGFDLVLLGLGVDGHTASLFPGSSVMADNSWAVAVQAPNHTAAMSDRVTLTLPAINAAGECLFVVTGAAKRAAVARVLGPGSPGDRFGPLPAARVSPRGGSLWFLDAAARGALAL